MVTRQLVQTLKDKIYSKINIVDTINETYVPGHSVTQLSGHSRCISIYHNLLLGSHDPRRCGRLHHKQSRHEEAQCGVDMTTTNPSVYHSKNKYTTGEH